MASATGSDSSSSSTYFTPARGKKCRVCSDFKSWTKHQGKTSRDTNKPTDVRPDCPVDREELGRATWTFLHTMAAYYPEHPTKKQRNEMTEFVKTFSKFYPCEDCAQHMQSRLDSHPPSVASQSDFAVWMCETHNEVNERLGKPTFDCAKVSERWRDGWKDGSCD